MSVAEEIQEFMKNQAWPTKVTRGAMPPTPDTCVTVFINAGSQPDNDASLVNPNIQFLCRAPSDKEAEALAWRVFELFNDRTMYTLQTLYVVQSFALASPAYIGRDESGRALYTVNFRFKLKVHQF